jgi:prepilin-type N-terminal cleavage/methylation domain-containing protein
MKTKHGFTLIELMVVIAIIGILIGTTFKLMGVAVDSKARAVTIARMERLQNALSGYYSAYGMYPNVPPYGSANPDDPDHTSESSGATIGSGTKESAQAAARVQPVGFEYPTPVWMDDKIPILFYPQNVISVNTAIGSLSPTDDEWDKYKGFKFGLMSFLLPRVEIVGHPNEGNNAPTLEVFQRAQWVKNNPASSVPGNSNASQQLLKENLAKQRVLENEACIRWLPCFENILRSFAGSITLKDADNKNMATVHLNGDEAGGHRLAARNMKGGPTVALAFITITDGWGREFFYHSAPPYQSFKVWSAGPDGLTFPPWIPSTDATYKKLKAQNWTKDDIVGGKMQM